MTPERTIQRNILKELKRLGIYSHHSPNGAVLAGSPRDKAIQVNVLKGDGMQTGFPDLSIYTSEGRMGHLEVKTPKGKQNDAQKACQAILEGMGHRYAVIRSADELEGILGEWGWV